MPKPIFEPCIPTRGTKVPNHSDFTRHGYEPVFPSLTSARYVAVAVTIAVAIWATMGPLKLTSGRRR
jgi:hypothetical protein